jgi:hypothetical protein
MCSTTTTTNMNLLCDIPTFTPNHLFFLDTKKNMVIDGKFTKLVYSDSMVSLNGLYLYCPIDAFKQDHSKGKEWREFGKGTKNEERLQPDGKGAEDTAFTGGYKSEAYTSSLRSNRYTNEEGCTIVTKKIPILFSILNPTNLQIMKELNRIEHEILEYYNEYFKINKVNVYSLRNQLKSGNIRVVHKVTEPRSEEVDTREHRPLVVKISGIWETDMNVGITFKFQR